MSSSPKPVLCPRFSPCCLKLEVPLPKTRLNAIVVLNTSCEIDILNERAKKQENTRVSTVVSMNTVRLATKGGGSTFIAWTGNAERSVKMIKSVFLVLRRCRKLAWNIPYSIILSTENCAFKFGSGWLSLHDSKDRVSVQSP